MCLVLYFNWLAKPHLYRQEYASLVRLRKTPCNFKTEAKHQKDKQTPANPPLKTKKAKPGQQNTPLFLYKLQPPPRKKKKKNKTCPLRCLPASSGSQRIEALEVNALLGDHLGASRDLTVDTVQNLEQCMKRLEAHKRPRGCCMFFFFFFV